MTKENIVAVKNSGEKMHDCIPKQFVSCIIIHFPITCSFYIDLKTGIYYQYVKMLGGNNMILNQHIGTKWTQNWSQNESLAQAKVNYKYRIFF